MRYVPPTFTCVAGHFLILLPSAPLPPGTSQAAVRGFMPSDATAPIYSTLVAAGFPSPADDHLESKLDLHELMVKAPGSDVLLPCRW